MITGYQWHNLQKNYPSGSTRWRHFEEWTSYYGLFEAVWSELLSELDTLSKIDWKEAAANARLTRERYQLVFQSIYFMTKRPTAIHCENDFTKAAASNWSARIAKDERRTPLRMVEHFNATKDDT